MNYTSEEDTWDANEGGNKLNETEAGESDGDTDETVLKTNGGLLDFLRIAITTNVFIGGNEDVDEKDEADEEEDEIDDVDAGAEGEEAGDGGVNIDVGGDLLLDGGGYFAKFFSGGDGKEIVHKIIIIQEVRGF